MNKLLRPLLLGLILLTPFVLINSPLIVIQPVDASPDLEGPRYPTGTVQVIETPYDDEDWANPSFVQLDDGQYASITAASFDSPDYSYVLYTNFSFTIPSGVTIEGIIVDIERKCDAGAAKDAVVQLVKAGTRQGDDKADTVTSWPATDTVKSYGGSTDKWSLAWDVGDINSANFGVALAAQATGTNTDIDVDFIRVTVYHTSPIEPPQGPRYPTVVANVSETPYVDEVWDDPANVKVADSLYASITAASFDSSDYSYVLYAYFSFTIPSGVTIDGIIVEIQRKCSEGAAKDAVVQLVKGGTRQGDDKADTVTSWPATDTVKSYGGSTDKWGLAWDVGDINSANFGVALAVQATAGNTDIYVDFIRVTVYYHLPSIFVDPSSVSTVEGFTVNVNISDVQDLYGWTFQMSWNDTLMHVATVAEGGFLKSGGNTYFIPKIYNDKGYILISDTLLWPAPVGVDGDGTLATIYFTSSNATGSCALHLYETELLDSFSVQISHTLTDGSFDNTGLTLIPVADVFVDPSSVATVRGFTVNINVSDVTQLHSYQVRMMWDASLFNCSKVVEGPFLKGGGSTSFNVLSINNIEGKINVKHRLTGATASVSGDGTLFMVYFTSPWQTGTCALDLYGLSPPTGTDYVLRDVNDNYWFHNLTDGSFDNTGLTLIPVADVYVHPASVATTSPFSIDVKISSAKEVYSYEFELWWDSFLIDCSSVTEGSFLSDVDTTTFYQSIDNVWGYVYVNCTLSGSIPQNGSGTLVTIQFGANKSSGECTLDLLGTPTDFFLHDIDGNYWSHTATDGYYTTVVTVPEFPLGLAMEMALTVGIIYMWWKRKRKTQTYNPAST